MQYVVGDYPSDRWDTERNCTPGDIDCVGGGGEEAPPIRMTEQDAVRAAQWQRESGFRLDMVYNAGSGEEWKAEHGGTDALVTRLLADRNQYRWINHTYTHPFLGCVQDVSVVPWRCAQDAAGNTRWTSRAEISAQIRDNHNWAVRKGIAVDRTELEDARWFDRVDVLAMLAGTHPHGLITPPPVAIAHHIIRAWVEQEVEFR